MSILAASDSTSSFTWTAFTLLGLYVSCFAVVKFCVKISSARNVYDHLPSAFGVSSLTVPFCKVNLTLLAPGVDEPEITLDVEEMPLPAPP